LVNDTAVFIHWDQAWSRTTLVLVDCYDVRLKRWGYIQPEHLMI
jgi:hypothetical protein